MAKPFLPASLIFTGLIALFFSCKPGQQPNTTAPASPGDSGVSGNKEPVSDTSNATLTETYWKLTELMGQPIGPTPADKREIHIKFREEGNKVEGFGGCNGFGALYELKPGNRILIRDIISTFIACPELESENTLKEVLGRADNYSLSGGTLTLNKARMAPLARFEAVYFD